MIILLHGPDTFRSQQKRNELIAAYRSKYASGLSESFFSDANFSLRAFEEHARGQALFSGKRLIVLCDVSQHKTALGELEASVKKNSMSSNRDVFIVFWEGRDIQKIKEAAFLLKAASLAQAFPFLQGNAYRTWVLQTSRSVGAHFTAAALEVFLSWHTGDSWRTVSDMQKLHAYTGGQEIGVADVERLCAKPLALSIFTTLDLLYHKKSAEAFAALEKHIQNGEEALYLFKMFSYQLRLIALVKEALEAATPASSRSLNVAGVHPYALKKTIPLARVISWQDLSKLFCSLYQSDAAIKQDTADAVLCLEMFAFEVMRA